MHELADERWAPETDSWDVCLASLPMKMDGQPTIITGWCTVSFFRACLLPILAARHIQRLGRATDEKDIGQ
jgi:hypothetical protein